MTGERTTLDAHAIARYERGQSRWPGQQYRDGLRAVLGVATDAEIGFYPTKRGSAAREIGHLSPWEMDTLTGLADLGSKYVGRPRNNPCSTSSLGSRRWARVVIRTSPHGSARCLVTTSPPHRRNYPSPGFAQSADSPHVPPTMRRAVQTPPHPLRGPRRSPPRTHVPGSRHHVLAQTPRPVILKRGLKGVDLSKALRVLAWGESEGALVVATELSRACVSDRL